MSWKWFALQCIFLHLFLFTYSMSDDRLSASVSAQLDQILIRSVQDIERTRPFLEQCLVEGRQKSDTSAIVRSLIGLCDVERFTGNYDRAFDFLWEAMDLLQQNDMPELKTRVFRNVAILYGLFHKDTLAVSYLQQSIVLAKSMLEEDQRKLELVSSYFSLATIYRGQKNYLKALACLDSCSIVRPGTFLPYVDAERGYIYFELGQFRKATKFLKPAHEHFLTKNQNYVAVTAMFMGDLMQERGLVDSAITFYKQSLSIAGSRQVFPEYQTQVLQRLAHIYSQRKEYEQALGYFRLSHEIWQALFDAANQQNNRLFEIKDVYRDKLARQQQVIDNQRIRLAAKQKILWLFIVLSVLIVLAAVATVLVVRLRLKVRNLNVSQRLREEKNRVLLNQKSKELTAYTLQLIDMKKAVEELLQHVKELAPERFNSLKQKYHKSSANLWEEFNLRFLQINSGFYERLREKHPELTDTELKHCALIKLNLDSNEMARVLNISLQSVHTSRYRIRKKLELPHGESLSHYIAQF